MTKDDILVEIGALSGDMENVLFAAKKLKITLYDYIDKFSISELSQYSQFYHHLLMATNSLNLIIKE